MNHEGSKDDYLLGDAFWPLTGVTRFYEASAAAARNAWTDDPYDPDREEYRLWDEDGDFRSLLGHLLPVTQLATRALFVSAGATWSAQFLNTLYDVNLDLTAQSMSEKLACRVAAVMMSKDTVRSRGTVGKPGGAAVYFYDSGERLRFVRATREYGRWSFAESGEPFEFETQEAYEAKRIQNRLRPSMVVEYLDRWAGIRSVDPSFYAQDEKGFYVETHGAAYLPAFNLEEAQAQR